MLEAVKTRDWGLPSTVGRRRLVTAVIVDSLGSGLFLPFSVVFFVVVADLPLPQVGLALSLAATVALPVAPLVGSLVDRVGPRAIITGANLVRAVAFGGYLVLHSVAALVVFAALASVGDTAFWSANSTLVAAIADEGERDRWFGMERAVRNAGFGLGGLLSGVAVVYFGDVGYRLLVAVNGASFLVAAALVVTSSVAAPHRDRARRDGLSAKGEATDERIPDAPSGYRLLAKDREFRRVMASNVLFALAGVSWIIVLTLYTVRDLGLSPLVPGVLFAINTVLVVLGQSEVVRWAERQRRADTLVQAALCWALSFVLLPGALLAVPDPVRVCLLVLATLVYTAAEMLYAPTMSGLVAGLAPSHLLGRYTAMFQLSWSVALLAAPALLITLLDASPVWCWGALAAASLAAAALLMGLRDQLSSREGSGGQGAGARAEARPAADWPVEAPGEA